MLFLEYSMLSFPLYLPFVLQFLFVDKGMATKLCSKEDIICQGVLYWNDDLHSEMCKMAIP